MWFPFPVVKGQSGIDDQGVQWTVASTDTVVETGAGSFHCVRYDRPSVNETYFVSPGTGVIRKLFIDDYSVNTQGQYTRLARGIVSLAKVQGLVP